MPNPSVEVVLHIDMTGGESYSNVERGKLSGPLLFDDRVQQLCGALAMHQKGQVATENGWNTMQRVIVYSQSSSVL